MPANLTGRGEFNPKKAKKTVLPQFSILGLGFFEFLLDILMKIVKKLLKVPLQFAHCNATLVQSRIRVSGI